MKNAKEFVNNKIACTIKWRRLMTADDRITSDDLIEIMEEYAKQTEQPRELQILFLKLDDIRIAIQRLSNNRRDCKDDGLALDFLGREFGKAIKEFNDYISLGLKNKS